MNDVFLFKVDGVFNITGIGIVLTPGLGEKKASLGDKVKLITPDGRLPFTVIKGVAFDIMRSLHIDTEFKKEYIPIGTEVWLIN